MNTKTVFTILITLLAITPNYSQSKSVTKYLKEQEELQKKEFPSPLSNPYPERSLGNKIQELYEIQAKDVCGIIRTDDRLYIPKEIVSNYGDSKLRSTLIFDVPISATNLMFLALQTSDIDKIIQGTFNEQEFINAKRIIGINDKLVNFGQSVLTPITGFPSLFYQKSCGSYFVGDVTGRVKAPIAELEASLDAETKKSTSITTVTGNYFSPLYLILRQNTAQSVYAHLLIWEIYREHFNNNANTSNPLYVTGKYISEFSGTLTNRALNSDQSIDMSGRLSTNISLGVFNSSGSINAGNENKVSFELRDFNTSVHLLPNNKLSWDLSDLPRVNEINQKLQNSLDFKPQPSFSGFASHLIPTEITRILVGVPTSLCDRKSWNVAESGFNQNIWIGKPTVISSAVLAKENEYPQCICKITGFLKKEAIDAALRANGFIELLLTLENLNSIDGNKLSIEIFEPVLRVTDNPKISSINSESINANREEIKVLNKIQFNYPIQFIINSTGIRLTEPYKITNLEIEYVNKETETNTFTIVNGPTINGNSVGFDIRSKEKPQTYIQQGELVVPIKIKFNIEISGGTTTQLVTNTLNLVLPNLIEEVQIKSNVTEN